MESIYVENYLQYLYGSIKPLLLRHGRETQNFDHLFHHTAQVSVHWGSFSLKSCPPVSHRRMIRTIRGTNITSLSRCTASTYLTAKSYSMISLETFNEVRERKSTTKVSSTAFKTWSGALRTAPVNASISRQTASRIALLAHSAFRAWR